MWALREGLAEALIRRGAVYKYDLYTNKTAIFLFDIASFVDRCLYLNFIVLWKQCVNGFVIIQNA